MMQIDGPKLQIYIKLADTYFVQAVLRASCGQAEYRHNNGEISIVSIAMAGMVTQKIRIANFWPDMPDESLGSNLAQFGKFITIQDQICLRTYRYAVANGLRNVTRSLTQNIPSHLTISGHILRRPAFNMLWMWRNLPHVSSLSQETKKREDNAQKFNINICEYCSTHHPNRGETPEWHGRTSNTHRTGESYCTNVNRYRQARAREWSVPVRNGIQTNLRTRATTATNGKKPRSSNREASPWNNRTRERSVERGHDKQNTRAGAQKPAWSRSRHRNPKNITTNSDREYRKRQGRQPRTK